MSVRQFIGLVGVVLIAVAATGLLWGITLTEPGLFGSDREVTCSNSITAEPWDGSSKLSSEKLTKKCADAAFPRRAIFWPLGAVGAIALVGAVLTKPSSPKATS